MLKLSKMRYLFLSLSIPFIFLLISSNETEEISSELVIEKFLIASGGFDKWVNIETIEIKKVLTKTVNSVETHDSSLIIYRDQPLTVYHKTENSTHINYSDAMFTKSENSKEWKNMFAKVGRVFGISYEYKHYTHFWALEFAKQENLYEAYVLSDKSFGEEHYVLEQKPLQNKSNQLSKEEKCFILFSKSTGLIDYTYTFKDNQLYGSSQYYDYKNIDGYIVPTKKVSGFASGKNLDNTLKDFEIANREAKKRGITQLDLNHIFSPSTSIYNVVKFNQPIDESVFEMK